LHSPPVVPPFLYERQYLARLESSDTRALNVVVYNTALKALAALRQPVAALGVLARMARRGHPPDAVSFNTVIDACARSGDLQLGE
jgi:pentatricopeptide repeat protein